MGYLDNSTTNIILDAVLTDMGRKLLAKNDGSFAITKFALGDDDVDYSVVKNFGRIIGKEKIEKNTPVMEALTNENVAQKYRLMSLVNQDLFKVPKLSLVTGATSDIVSLSTTIAGSNKKAITLEQAITDQSFDIDLIDQNFVVYVNNRFLQVEGDSPTSVDAFQTARYFIPRDSGTVSNGSKVTFTLKLKTITNTMFTTYGKTQDKNTILTYVRVQGINTGVTKEFTTSISK